MGKRTKKLTTADVKADLLQYLYQFIEPILKLDGAMVNKERG